MNQTNLSYNRQTRKWELTGQIGELLKSFPPGPAGRQAAVIAQLEIEAPQALALALQLEDAFSNLQGRALRGAQIAADNGIIRTSGRQWRARSQKSPRNLYDVYDLTGQGFRCRCRDWDSGNEGRSPGAPRLRRNGTRFPACKHVIAVLISEKLRPQPDEDAARSELLRLLPLMIAAAPHIDAQAHWQATLQRIQSGQAHPLAIIASTRRSYREMQHTAADRKRDTALPVQYSTGKHKLFKS